MDFSEPPPILASTMGAPGGFRPNFRHPYKPFQNQRTPYVPQLPLTLEDFDGKRLRKSTMRKTVDYNASITKALQFRIWQRDWRDRPALQPDAMYTPDLLPPASYIDNPINAVTTKFVRTASNKAKCPIFTLAWTPEGRRLVTGASSGEFTLWNGLTFNFETILQAHEASVRAMVWSHNEGWMVTGDHAGFVKYWQSNMNNVKMFEAHKEAVRGISFSPTDSKIVTCSDDGTLRIFDFYRCQEERILRGHGADVKCVEWHPQKSIIISGSKDNQQPIKLWDPKSGLALATLHAHKSTVMDLKWNENGNWLVTASRDHLLKLFDIRKLGSEVQVFRGHKKEASSVAWHPVHEGLFCSGGSDGSILFWNVGTDKEVGSIEAAHDSLVWSLAWHPVGHILASGSNDLSSKFWTRNRPGALMRDKYNLNTLPAGILDDQDLDEIPAIPGMGPEDKVENIFPSQDKDIPGLDLDTSILPLDSDRKIKKVPYSKPIPKSFQAAWNYGTTDIPRDTQAYTQTTLDMAGAIPLDEVKPNAIFIYGKLLLVEHYPQIEKAIQEGESGIRKLVMSADIEELWDVMPHFENVEDDDTFVTYDFPDNEEEVKDNKYDDNEVEYIQSYNEISNHMLYDKGDNDYAPNFNARNKIGNDYASNYRHGHPRPNFSNFQSNTSHNSEYRALDYRNEPNESFGNSSNFRARNKYIRDYRSQFKDDFQRPHHDVSSDGGPPSLLSMSFSNVEPPPYPVEQIHESSSFSNNIQDYEEDNTYDRNHDLDESYNGAKLQEHNEYASGSKRRGGFRNRATNGVHRSVRGGVRRGRGVGARRGARGSRGNRGGFQGGS